MPSLHPLWMVPIIAGGLGLAVFLALRLYGGNDSKAPEKVGQRMEAKPVTQR